MSDDESTAVRVNELWERLAHVSRELLTIAEPDGTITYADPAFEYALGWSVEEIMSQRGIELVHPDDRALAARSWREVVDTPGAESRTEYRLRTRDGGWRWMEVATVNLTRDDIIGGVATYLHDVTGRHDAEEALRTSEERFRALVQHSYDALVVTDADIVASWVSPAFETMFGYEPAELVGVRGIDHVHPDDLSAVRAAGPQLFGEAGARTTSTFRMRHRSGGWRWVECRSVNLLHHPAVRGVVNSFRDITDEQEALAALAQSESRLWSLLQNADSAVVISDERGNIRWCSAPIERLLGDGPDSLLGGSLISRIHRDDRAGVLEDFLKVLEAPGLVTRSEARVRHLDGGYRWFEAVWTNCLEEPAVAGIVANMRDVTERVLADSALRESEARLEHQATHDPLTDLPNRILLAEQIEVIRAGVAPSAAGVVALLYFDLDHFKWVNDSRGHDVGDELLVAVARRLERAVRPGAVVARFGGDEYAVLCADLRTERGAVAEAVRLQHEITGTYELRGSEVFVGVSVGVATAAPEAATVEGLVRDADSAMYEAKQRGRERIEVFDGGMRARAIRRHELEGWLRRAVGEGELRLHFQPLVDLTDGRIAGAEALVRWQHPEQGLLLPGAFIEVAEQTGIVLAIDHWVLEHAVRVASSWPTRFGGAESTVVCVNLSARQFGDPRLITRLEDTLRRYHLPADRLHVEITEGVVMDDVEGSIRALGALRTLGVKVAIDDFGTGYSSLSYLRRLPVDVLKIDRAFVRGLGRDDHDTAIVEAVVDLAHRLDLEVVAEGVEDESQLDHLTRIGCDVAQGFLLSRPIPPDDFDAMLRAPTPW
jgi:diguanylate cyclase (GGDEF)-like protein/PAS domain S-box-containing protein